MTDEPTPSPEDTPAAPEPAPAPTSRSAPSSPVPAGIVKPTGRYTVRFGIIYAALGVILIGAVAGLVVLLVGSSSSSSVEVLVDLAARQGHDGEDGERDRRPRRPRVPPEQEGRPARRRRRRSAPGDERDTQGHDLEHRRPRRPRQTTKGIQIIPSGEHLDRPVLRARHELLDRLGTATETRGRLVRREALEVALYTFKFVPAIHSVVAFMPPPPGSTQTTLLYLQKDNLAKELSQPLAKTLPLVKPPLPTSPDTQEAPTIDKLTLPAVYKYSLQQLQDASALLVLNPFQT